MLTRPSRTLLALTTTLIATTAQALPPCAVGAVTRAGVISYDARILQYSEAKGLYEIEYIKGYPGERQWMPASVLRSCAGKEPSPVSPSYFHGTWLLFTGGGGIWQKTSGGSWVVKSTQSASAPPLIIRPDGSYTWKLDSKTTVQGRWRPARPDELKDGYDKRGTTILLEKGEMNMDWLVTRYLIQNPDGRDRILIEGRTMGLSYRGGRKD